MVQHARADAHAGDDGRHPLLEYSNLVIDYRNFEIGYLIDYDSTTVIKKTQVQHSFFATTLAFWRTACAAGMR